MNKIKRFITCNVPVQACNFRCSYCYLPQTNNKSYKGGIQPFFDSVENMAKAFSIKRLGGPCYFNLCAAGETMLHPELINLISVLTGQGHYCDIITNGTLTQKFETLVATLTEEQKSHLFIKFSFHYLQLLEKNLMETFVNNVNLIKANKISFTLEITPHDELIPYIDEIKDFSLKTFGALPHITVARNEATKEIELLTKYPRDEYKKIWSTFNSSFFDFKIRIFNKKRCEFCYAGEWSFQCFLDTGDYYQCYIGKKLGNIKDKNKPFNFQPIGKCQQPHCFNGHAFLTLGDIPEFKTPTYTDMRNMIFPDGTESLQPVVKEFFSSKLCESNKEYSENEKLKFYKMTNRNMKFYGIKRFSFRVAKKVLRILKGKK